MKEKDVYLVERILPPENGEVQELKKGDKVEIGAKETDQLVSNDINYEDQKEKEYLIKIFHNIEKEITKKENENKSLTNIYNDMMNEEDDDNQINFKIAEIIDLKWDNFCCRGFLHFTFIIILPSFAILYLFGIFILLSIMRIFFEVLKKGVFCFLKHEPENENYEFLNFYEYYIKESLDEGIDFDVMTTMSFLGGFSLKYNGFFVSTIFNCTFIVSSISLILYFFGHYRKPDIINTFTFNELVQMSLCYIMLFLSVGMSALFSQTILTESFYKYKQFLRMKRKKKEIQKERERLRELEEQELKKASENEKKEGEQKIEVVEEEKDGDPSEKIKVRDEEKRKTVEEVKRKIEQNESSKENSSFLFFLTCFTLIIAFLGKYSLNMYISSEKFKYDSQYNHTNIKYY